MTSPIYQIKQIGNGSLSAMAKPLPADELKSDIAQIAKKGITSIVSLMQISEAEAAGLGEEQVVAEEHGLQFTQYEIGDYGVPASLDEYSRFIKQLYTDIAAGQHTVVHCYAGIGRTGLVTTSILLHCGYTAAEAFSLVSEQRGAEVPDTQQQKKWLLDNQSSLVGE